MIATFTFPDVPPWQLQTADFLYVLRNLGKTSETPPETFQSTYNQIISDHHTHVKIFTDASKEDEKVAIATVSDGRVSLCRLPNNASIFMAELRVILMATKIIETSHRKSFPILVDSISCI
jgi:hypothetical protein